MARILYADDEAEKLNLGVRMLSSLPQNPEVITAGTPEEAIALIQTQIWDIVVTDQEFVGSKKTGTDVARAAKERGVPHVFINSSKELQAQELPEGVQYAYKPIWEIREKVGEALEKK